MILAATQLQKLGLKGGFGVWEGRACIALIDKRVVLGKPIHLPQGLDTVTLQNHSLM